MTEFGLVEGGCWREDPTTSQNEERLVSSRYYLSRQKTAFPRSYICLFVWYKCPHLPSSRIKFQQPNATQCAEMGKGSCLQPRSLCHALNSYCSTFSWTGLPCLAVLSQESLRAPNPHLLRGPLGASSGLCCPRIMSSSSLLLSTLNHSLFVFLHWKPAPCSLSWILLFIRGLGLFVFHVFVCTSVRPHHSILESTECKHHYTTLFKNKSPLHFSSFVHQIPPLLTESAIKALD